MSLFALAICSTHALAVPVIYDGRDCELKLSSTQLQKLISDASPRKALGDVATYIPGDSPAKLLDVQGKDKRAMAEAIIRQLRFREDVKVSPLLQPVIETTLSLAEQMGAVFSISSWTMPDTGLRTIRMSLDMADDPAARVQVIRLPNMDIRNGVIAKRIDIDLSPERLAVLMGTAQALRGHGNLVVSEPASHSRWLEISTDNPEHVVFDAGMAPVEQFIGEGAHPALRGLLVVAEDLSRQILPRAQDKSFKTDGEIKAVNYGHGWQVSH